MGKILSIITFVIALTIGLVACGNNECFDNQTTLPLAGFYSMQSQKAIQVDSLTVYGVGAPGDSLLLDNERKSKVYLPLPLSGNSTSFVFQYNQKGINYVELNDTLTINYDSYPQFISNECGVIYKYKVKDFFYTHHIIDSIAIPTMEFNNKDIETIFVFFRTANE